MAFGGQITFSIAQKLKKIRPSIFFFGPTKLLRPFATNHAARHMGSGPRPSTHRNGALPLAYTCYLGPRARFINIYLRVVCLTSHYLLTTYLMTVNKQSKKKSACWAGDQLAAFFFSALRKTAVFRRPKPKIGFFGGRRRSKGLIRRHMERRHVHREEFRE